jgi:hypothetical protein
MLRCETVPRQHILTLLDAAALSGKLGIGQISDRWSSGVSGLRALLTRHSPAGRPRADRKIRRLIRHMSSANPLWAAPRIPEPFPWDIAPDAERGFTRDKAGYVDLL